MDVEYFDCVYVGSFSVAVYYLHDIIYGAKWVGFFNEVLCETECVAVVAKGCLMLFVSCGEQPDSLSNLCFIAIGTSSFI